ncbi:MAG: formate-dependent phosphoribosylglycinamide formyltransferase [Candidatus Peribacteraceae bacterium]|nr:formate-dependent phosphoribosylglycinamide formyltransferase [Candidatus Peribacteraceae bacterium]
MLGTPLTSTATKLMLLGCGELGKEVVIEAQRLGVEVIGVDRYENAPAMQVAHKSFVIDMQSDEELRKVIESEKPDYIVPEIEAINTELLLELEKEGFNVIPTARATNLTMNREGIRRLAAEELKLPTAKYAFAENLDEFKAAVEEIGIPCVVKPIQSSSGKGQSTIKSEEDIEKAFEYALSGSRGKSEKVIIEEFVKFDTEITLLTVRHVDGISFCPPVGHVQIAGDYRESWQPQGFSDAVIKKCEEIAGAVVENLGGRGIFGVELFIAGDDVIFSEVSPRPHDTGLVTLISQNLSEFELHVRAILGLPIPEIKNVRPAASRVILAAKNSENISFEGIDEALKEKDTAIRLFGKPSSRPNRRLGVCLAADVDVEKAREKTGRMLEQIKVVEE